MDENADAAPLKIDPNHPTTVPPIDEIAEPTPLMPDETESMSPATTDFPAALPASSAPFDTDVAAALPAVLNARLNWM